MNNILKGLILIHALNLFVTVILPLGRKVELTTQAEQEPGFYGDTETSGEVRGEWLGERVYSIEWETESLTAANVGGSCSWSHSDCSADNLEEYWTKQGLCQMPVWGFLARCDSLNLEG